MREPEAKRERRAERGYNLVEVLIAVAVLGTILLTILTLFVMGRKNVYSGKQMTRATSAATHVAEDLNAMTTDDIWTAFNVTSTTSTTSPTLAGVSYSNVIVRDTTQANGTNDPKLYLDRWAKLLPASAIKDGKVTLILTPTDLATSGNVTTARIVRVRILAEWKEARRKRNVTLDTIKLNRV